MLLFILKNNNNTSPVLRRAVFFALFPNFSPFLRLLTAKNSCPYLRKTNIDNVYATCTGYHPHGRGENIWVCGF